jgi:hypothetical protein
MGTTVVDPGRAQHLLDMAWELADLMGMVEGELELAIYRAHQLGLPHDEIARQAQRDVAAVGEVVREYDRYDLGDDQPEISWARWGGNAIYL